MSDWSLISRILDIYELTKNDRYYIHQGLGWNIQYNFDMIANSTTYLAFETGEPEIHATSRRVKAIGLDNQLIDVRVTTLKNATIDVLGNNISNRVFNGDLNLNNSIELNMYDETTTIADEGTEAPFSSRMRADRRQAAQEFITNEYILRKNNFRVLKFENLGDGSVEIEYASSGYQEEEL